MCFVFVYSIRKWLSSQIIFSSMVLFSWLDVPIDYLYFHYRLG